MGTKELSQTRIKEKDLVRSEDITNLRHAVIKGAPDLSSALGLFLNGAEKAVGRPLGIKGSDLVGSLIGDLKEGTALCSLVTLKGLPLIFRLNEFYSLAGKDPFANHDDYQRLAGILMGKDPDGLVNRLKEFMGTQVGGSLVRSASSLGRPILGGDRVDPWEQANLSKLNINEVDLLIAQVEAAEPLIKHGRYALEVLGVRYGKLKQVDDERKTTEGVSGKIVEIGDGLINKLDEKQQAVLGLEKDMVGLQDRAEEMFTLASTDQIERFRDAQNSIRKLASKTVELEHNIADRDELDPRIKETASASLGHNQVIALINEMHRAIFNQYFDARIGVNFGVAALTGLLVPVIRIYNRAIIQDSTEKRMQVFNQFADYARTANELAQGQVSAYLQARNERE